MSVTVMERKPMIESGMLISLLGFVTIGYVQMG